MTETPAENPVAEAGPAPAALKHGPASPSAPTPPSAPSGAAVWRPAHHGPLVIVGVVVMAVISIGAILSAWDLLPFTGAVASTENAYVRGRTTVIAPQVSGYVTEVSVRDYESITEGEVLIRVDDRIYQARVELARANLATAEAALANSAQAHASRLAAVLSQKATLTNARAQLLRARADMGRAEELVGDGSISGRERDLLMAALAQALAQVDQANASGEIAKQDVRTVDVGRGGLEAQVEAARAQLRLAEIDLSNTVIRAPEGGELGEIGVRRGQYVTNGTQLFALVPSERWVIANFKEAQTEGMAVGQPATVMVDALGGARLAGHVERLSPAAGSEFAVLKPDNATGNFVKIPQRIGVRVALDPDQGELKQLRPGMSVEVRVNRGKSS